MIHLPDAIIIAGIAVAIGIRCGFGRIAEAIEALTKRMYGDEEEETRGSP